MTTTDEPVPATFDDDVRRAIAKWPNVPDCYDWLALDRRGNWLIKGAVITHRRAVAFLGRNYAHTPDGCWFVQNGPQRAFCRLAYTPWVYRMTGDAAFATHTGLPCAAIDGLFVDESGDALLYTEHGIGLIDDRDLGRFVDGLHTDADPSCDDTAARLYNLGSTGGAPVTVRWGERLLVAEAIRSAAVATRFGFEPEPRPTGA